MIQVQRFSMHEVCCSEPGCSYGSAFEVAYHDGIAIFGVSDVPSEREGSSGDVRLAVSSSVQFVSRRVRHGMSAQDIEGIVRSSFSVAYHAMKDAAHRAGSITGAGDVALCVGVWDGLRLSYGQAGDCGVIAALETGEYQAVTTQQRDGNQAVVSLRFGPDTWAFGTVPERVSMVFMATAGIFDCLCPPLLGETSQPVYAALMRDLAHRMGAEPYDAREVYSRLRLFAAIDQPAHAIEDAALLMLCNTERPPLQLEDAYYQEPDWDVLGLEAAVRQNVARMDSKTADRNGLGDTVASVPDCHEGLGDEGLFEEPQRHAARVLELPRCSADALSYGDERQPVACDPEPINRDRGPDDALVSENAEPAPARRWRTPACEMLRRCDAPDVQWQNATRVLALGLDVVGGGNAPSHVAAQRRSTPAKPIYVPQEPFQMTALKCCSYEGDRLDSAVRRAYRSMYHAMFRYDGRVELSGVSEADITDAYESILFGAPEAIWLDGYNLRRKDISLQSWSVFPEYRIPKRDAMRMLIDMEELTSPLLERLRALPSNEQRAQVAHDALILNCSYSDMGNPREATAAGALLDGRAHCMGISLAYKYLMDRLNIPCIVVRGTAHDACEADDGVRHAWNLVQIRGCWCHVDVTYDMGYTDEKTRPFFAYLGVSDEEICATHTWERSVFPGATYSLKLYSRLGRSPHSWNELAGIMDLTLLRDGYCAFQLDEALMPTTAGACPGNEVIEKIGKMASRVLQREGVTSCEISVHSDIATRVFEVVLSAAGRP